MIATLHPVVQSIKTRKVGNMKWKGGRQSKNVVDKTNDPPLILPKDTLMVDGKLYDPETMDNKRTRVARKFKEIDESGRIPTPTPKPQNKITSTQVTPGKWKSK